MNRTLYHFRLCPFSRRVRLHLAEKRLQADMIDEPFWERRPAFARLNPASEVPVMAEPGGKVFAESHAISEYIENAYPEPRLLGAGIESAAETRRLIFWCDIKFFQDVTWPVLGEKVLRYYLNMGAPESHVLHEAARSMGHHIVYFEDLLKERRWLAGNEYSLADMALAGHVSVLDYLSFMKWSDCPALKHWYSLVKSRPGFREMLLERVPGFTPPPHYANPDF